MLEKDIRQILDGQEIELNERLGQHFLIDEVAVSRLVACVNPGAHVLEVGAGIGHVTQAIAQVASEVVAVEIDQRFEDPLRDIEDAGGNIRVVMGDVLRLDLQSLVQAGETQVVANLPFHITEPFLTSLAGLPIESAVLILGDSAAAELVQDESSLSYGKLSMLAQTFFDIRVVGQIESGGFYPPPRTGAAIVELTPRDKEELKTDPTSYVFSYLIGRSSKNGLVMNDLKQALVDAERVRSKGTSSKQEANRRTRAGVKRELRNMARAYSQGGPESEPEQRRSSGAILSQADAIDRIERAGIRKSVIDKPLFAMNNSEIRELVSGVKRIFGR